MENQIVKFKITGMFPLLTHNPASMEGGGEVKTGKKKIPSSDEEAKAGLYVDEKGNYCIPSCAFRSALLNGLKHMKVGKSSAISVYQAAVFNVDDISVLIDPKTESPLKKYTIDKRRAVIKNNGIIRSRPRFEKWGCFLYLQIDTDYISVEDVKNMLNNAGMKIGVGDFRIEKRGPFGRFSAAIVK